MKVFIIGATGLLGQSLVSQGTSLGVTTVGTARQSADIQLDIRDTAALEDAIVRIRPDVVINSAALVDIELCQADPGEAYLVNARPAAVLAHLSERHKFYFLQISTDHFFTGQGRKAHCEDHPVTLLNEYARTKYAGEQFALSSPASLVVRTNIIGLSPQRSNPTFLKWVLDSLITNKEMTLFDDFFTSSIDVDTFSRIIFEVLALRPAGILNVASSQVFSKKEFIEGLAIRLGLDLKNTRTGSVTELKSVRRAESLGLNVSRAERLIDRKLPDLNQLIDSAVVQYQRLKEQKLEV